MNKRYKIWRRVLIFWTLFIGIGAVGGASCMIFDTSGKTLGMDAMLPYFQVLPFAEVLFQDFLFSGIMLLIVNGITNLVAAGLLFAKKKAGIISGAAFGVTLMAWIVIQFVIFPFNFMSTAYFIFGALQFIAGVLCYVGYRQSEFTFDAADYKNIGNDKSRLVVYFSRTGYTRKLAYEHANETGAEIFELETEERIGGDLGFWWCGRFGMEKLPMKLVKTPENLGEYEEVTVFSPTWVFGISAPVREFIKVNAGELKRAKYVFTHFMKGSLKGLKKEAIKLGANENSEYEEYRCRFGVTKKIV